MTDRIAALIPCHDDREVAGVVARTLPHVSEVLVVADAPPRAMRPALDALVGDRVGVVHRGPPPAKGDALACGTKALLDRAEPPWAVMILDADGQHPPECIPRFVRAAAAADVVIGTRRGDRSAMPALRRVGNDVTSALLSLLVARRLPDTQCGMRLWTAEALRRVPLPAGGFEAETQHLAEAARAGLEIAWVPIPAVYGDERSDFRTVHDSLGVLRAVIGAGAGRLRRGRG